MRSGHIIHEKIRIIYASRGMLFESTTYNIWRVGV